jgi:hypothetical protein
LCVKPFAVRFAVRYPHGLTSTDSIANYWVRELLWR